MVGMFFAVRTFEENYIKREVGLVVVTHVKPMFYTLHGLLHRRLWLAQMVKSFQDLFKIETHCIT